MGGLKFTPLKRIIQRRVQYDNTEVGAYVHNILIWTFDTQIPLCPLDTSSTRHKANAKGSGLCKR